MQSTSGQSSSSCSTARPAAEQASASTTRHPAPTSQLLSSFAAVRANSPLSGRQTRSSVCTTLERTSSPTLVSSLRYVLESSKMAAHSHPDGSRACPTAEIFTSKLKRSSSAVPARCSAPIDARRSPKCPRCTRQAARSSASPGPLSSTSPQQHDRSLLALPPRCCRASPLNPPCASPLSPPCASPLWRKAAVACRPRLHLKSSEALACPPAPDGTGVGALNKGVCHCSVEPEGRKGPLSRAPEASLFKRGCGSCSFPKKEEEAPLLEAPMPWPLGADGHAWSARQAKSCRSARAPAFIKTSGFLKNSVSRDEAGEATAFKKDVGMSTARATTGVRCGSSSECD
mmetsp:Transcript_12014/g.28381  ORF Transcript_12014/g.28381 Transcript_12014/m.28381 type:complete len:344 (-) Transcript_12014:606-1637(-)